MSDQKKQKVLNRDKQFENCVVVFTFEATGNAITCDARELGIDVDSLNPMGRQLVTHAINAKVGDSVANSKNLANPEQTLTEVWDELKNGNWTTRAEGGSQTNLTFEAMKRVTGKSDEEIRAFIDSKSKEELDAFREHAQIKAALDTIRAERAAEKAAKSMEAASGADVEDLSALMG